ncbi:MAG: ABC transporter ATP-binding protein [Dethiobacteria bacterium]
MPDGKTYKGLWEKGKLIKPLEKLRQDIEYKRSAAGREPVNVRKGEPAIYVEKLNHWYGKLQAVKDISFKVYPGEILGFLGPNGAGKSTTIKVLTGQLPLKGGKAQILGRDIGRDDSEMQAHIGVTFEEKNLYLEMTALENLNFFASLFGIRNPGSLEALKRVGLANRARDRVSQYSKGMRQRLMIARAFINKPSVLFLDEPTDGLDPVTASAIRKTIKEEAERGAAVLLTTHNMFEADELSNRVAFINEGEIVALDTAENLKLKYGKRSVLVRLRDHDGVREEELPLDGEKSSARLGKLAASPDLMTIHTEEATLEKIFIRLTGRGLAG